MLFWRVAAQEIFAFIIKKIVDLRRFSEKNLNLSKQCSEKSRVCFEIDCRETPKQLQFCPIYSATVVS